MTITYSDQLSAPLIAALQSRERYVRAALSALPAEGSFRWVLSTTADGSEFVTLRHVCDGDRCVVWFTRGEIQRKFTEALIQNKVAGQKRTAPGKDE